MDKKINFTKAYLENLPNAEKGKRYMVYDTNIPQLAIRVTDNGTKSFLIQKRVKSSPVKITLGRFPEMTIAQARSKAMEVLHGLVVGQNPNEEKNKLRREITLKELFHEFMERYSKKQKKSWLYDEREIPRFLSKWFNRKISDVTKLQVQKLHEQIGAESGIYQANRVLERLKSMYNRAIEWGWDGQNPCNGVKKFKEIKRDRFLQPQEFPAFFQSLEEETNIEAKNYIWLSLLTGARKTNVLAMRWEEIDFNRKLWHIPETKNGESLNVPLVDEALNRLLELRNTSDSDWVFPSPASKTGHLQDPKKAWKRVLDRSGIKDLRLHDIRRTLGSYQAITGASLNIIGKSLGHKTVAATQIYARLNDDPVRDSMQTAVTKMLEYKEH